MYQYGQALVRTMRTETLTCSAAILRIRWFMTVARSHIVAQALSHTFVRTDPARLRCGDATPLWEDVTDP